MVEEGQLGISSKKHSRRPSSTTSFGVALHELRTQYLFHANQLPDLGLLSRTDVEQISRLSSRRGAIATWSDERLEKLIGGIAHSITSFLEVERGLIVPEGLKIRLEQKLKIAAHKDLIETTQTPLAFSIATRLEELTGRSLIQLDFDLDSSEPSELFDLWKNSTLQNLG